MKQNKKIAVWLLAAAAVVAGIFGVYKLANNQPAGSGSGASVGEAASVLLAVRENDWYKGGKEAKAVLIEYSDFQCPACAAYAPILDQLVQEFGEDLKIIYRHYPLFQIHSNAILAAQASEAAGREGKFWEMHDQIFKGREEWEKSPAAKEIFKNYALTLGLDQEKFLVGLDSKEIKQKVADDLKEAQNLGFDYTPTFILNGKKIENPRSYEEFRNLISQILAQPEKN